MRVRRTAVPLLVAAAAVALWATSMAPASAAPSVERIAGANRWDTAAQISARSFEPHPEVAFITTSNSFPDALAAGPAAAEREGPVLLVRQDAIPQSVQEELYRLRAESMIVLGGPDVVSQRVLEKLQDTNYTNGTVTRIAGADRYATAALVSKATFDPGVPVVYVATGEHFADALSGAAAAGAAGGPLLLVRPDGIPASTATELDRLDPASIVLLGGTGAISSAVQTQLGTYSTSVVRRSGADRYATAAAVSAAAFPDGAPTAFMATGEDYADALAGSSPAGITPGPLLLVERTCVPSPVAAELTRLKVKTLVVLGGTSAVSDAAAGGVACGGLATTG
jgi:putative cell wall-binding protein